MRRRIVACLLTAAMMASGIGQTDAVVFAGNAAVSGVQSAEEAAPLAEGLAAPQNLRCTSPAADGGTTLQYSVSLAWDAVDGAASYTIYRAKDNPEGYKVWLDWNKGKYSEDPFVEIASGVKETTYTDSAMITTSVPYYYKIVAVDASGAAGAESTVLKSNVSGVLTQKNLEKYTDRALVGMDLAGKDGAETLVTATDANGKKYTKGVYLSWRSFEADFDDSNKLTTKFTVYKNGKAIAENLTVTNLIDEAGSAKDKYKVVGSNDAAIGVANQPEINPWSDKYLELSLYAPANQTMPKDADGDQEVCTYSANDMSVGDVDGDGDLELIVKWYPSNAKDNSNGGYTGETFLDTYDVDFATGKIKLLTRINMGINIRSGAHYTQFQVWDFDGDGKAEIAFKTSDGTTSYVSGDGTDKNLKMVAYVGHVDNTKLPTDIQQTEAQYDYRNSGGHVLVGDEYFSIFNLDDGTKAGDDVAYEPERGGTGQDMIDNWGDGKDSDSYGNRSERYNSAVAYLDGENPYAVFCRGYYERTALCAYHLVDTDNNGIGDKIEKYWLFDTGRTGTNPDFDMFRSQGNHGLSVNDVDNDGKDEIIFGSLIVDHDGTVKNSTGLGHGDAMHVSDWVSWNDGLEVMDVHEHDNVRLHVEVHDAETGEILMGYYTGKDTGRGAMADIDPTAEGAEWWSIASPAYEDNAEPEWDSNDGEVYASSSKFLGANGEGLVKLADNNPPANFTIFWDGDLLSEIQDHSFNNKDYVPRGVNILKWNYEEGKSEPLLYSSEIWSNNGTKGNVGLAADILGDWREEIITRTSDATGKTNTVRIYSTTIQTDYVVPCLLENLAYREGIAWQNVGYNQPANLSYLLSEGLVTAQLVAGDETVNTADILFTAANDGKYGHEITGYEVYRAEGDNGSYQKIDTIPVSALKEYTGEIPSETEEKGKEIIGYVDAEIVQKFDFGTKTSAEGFIAPTANDLYNAQKGWGFKEALSGASESRLGGTATGTEGYDAALATAAGDLFYADSVLPFVVDLDAGTYRVDVFAGMVENNDTYRTNTISVNGVDLGAVNCTSVMSDMLKTTTVTLDNRGQVLITANNSNKRAFMNAVVITKLNPIYSDPSSEGTPDTPSTGTDNQKWYVYTDSNLKENTAYQYKIAAIVDGKTSFLSREADVRTSVSIASVPQWDAIELVQNTPLKGSTVKELLPKEMNVTDASGKTVTTPVTWSGYAAVDISKVGDYTIYATVQGYTGDPVPAKVTIVPNKVAGLVEDVVARVVINTSVAGELPATVDLKYQNGTIGTVGVAWNEDDIKAIDVTKYTTSVQSVRGVCVKADYGAADYNITAAVTVEDDYILAVENLYPEIDFNTPAADIEALLPQTAVATYKLSGAKDVPVLWSNIKVDASKLGYYTGTADYKLPDDLGYPELKTAKISITYPLVKRFDFGVTDSPATAGWETVSVNPKDGTKTMDELGITYSPEIGYGFLGGSNSVQGRSEVYTMEGVLPSSVYRDFVIGDGQTFAVDLPNGTYQVTMVGGSVVGNNNVVQGVFNDGTKLSVTSKPEKYEMQEAIVTVDNGQLTFKWTGSTCRTNAMIIRSVPAVPEGPKAGDKIEAVGDAKSVYTYKKDGTVEFTSTSNTKAIIPNTIQDKNNNSYKVTSIAAKAFQSNKKITQVTIGDNVTAIATNQFAGMTKLSKVTIGTGVKTIGKNAFKGDKKLTTVTFKKTSKVATIKASAFQSCEGLKNITLPDSVKVIDTAAFSGCKALQTVKIGTSSKSALSTIRKNAFKNCKKIKTVTIKSTKLKTVQKTAFSGVKSTAKIKAPKSKVTAYTKLFKKAGCKAKVTK